ncbi:MAG: trigger factor [Oscillospiraceae bacterium]|jgi:trigger factor|nr:trigger factor [Oscillospiraceae bacterium]
MGLKNSKKIETNVYELEISVDAETFETAVNKAYKKIKGKINVPGFRAGKAPRGIIEKLYGPQVFYEDALDIVYPTVVEEAVKEAGLEIVDAPFDVDVPEIDKNGVVINLKVTVTPEVELGNYKGLKASRVQVEVSQEEVDEQLNQMLERNARFTSVEDRAVADSDMITLDFEGFTDGEPFDGGKAENYDLTIGSGSFIPGFEEQLIGHNVDDEFDIEVKFPEEYAQPLAGKDATFKVKINAVKQKELPELNDEFAKDVSEFDTILELSDDLHAQTLKRKQEESDALVEDQLLSELSKLVKAEIPPVMIEKQMDDGVNELTYRMQSQGMTLESYLQLTGGTKDDLRESMREKSEKQVKIRLALDKIIELENIDATAEDLEEQYKKLSDMYGVEMNVVKKAIAESEAVIGIKNERAIEIIKENAVITDEKPETKKDGDEKADTENKKPAKKTAVKKKPAQKPDMAKKSDAAEKEAESE